MAAPVNAVVYVKPSKADWTAIATNPALAAAVVSVAERGRGYARVFAESAKDTGRYANAFAVWGTTEVITTGYGPQLRAVAYLANLMPYAAAVEYGGAGARWDTGTGHHVLGRALDLMNAMP